MAGTAPTDFQFTKTPDAGPVHCSVWLCRSRTALEAADSKRYCAPKRQADSCRQPSHEQNGDPITSSVKQLIVHGELFATRLFRGNKAELMLDVRLISSR
jgi:hypothetical protein